MHAQVLPLTSCAHLCYATIPMCYALYCNLKRVGQRLWSTRVANTNMQCGGDQGRDRRCGQLGILPPSVSQPIDPTKLHKMKSKTEAEKQRNTETETETVSWQKMSRTITITKINKKNPCNEMKIRGARKATFHHT